MMYLNVSVSVLICGVLCGVLVFFVGHVVCVFCVCVPIIIFFF